MKQSFSLAFVLIGTLIGAGFATGQELYTFFARQGTGAGLRFAFSCGLLLSGSASCYFYSKRKGISSLEGYLQELLGARLGKAGYLISLLFLLACFCVTASGAGTLFRDSFQLPYGLGVFVILLVSAATLLYGIKGVIAVNCLLTPVILLSVLLLSGSLLLQNAEGAFASFSLSRGEAGMLPALLYAGYNLLSLLPIVISAGETDLSNPSAAGGFALSFLLLVPVGLMILGVLPVPMTEELPFLNRAASLGAFSETVYGMVLYFAMVTTAVSCFYSFVRSVSAVFRFPQTLTAGAGCLCAAVAVLFPFSALVERVYGFFGILGSVLLAASLYRWLCLQHSTFCATIKKRNHRM